MPCYHPLEAWYAKEINPSGKRSLVFNPRYALQPDDPIKISCGQCVGCRLERSRQWAVRCMHEASLYEKNCFVTLTFSPEGLERRNKEFEEQEKKDPDSVSGWNPVGVHQRDFQLFMKRLRKKYGKGCRYFYCGEYGDRTSRPHYHACLFNFSFDDQRLYKMSNGFPLYNSEEAEKLWPYGHVVIGEVTFESAAYVARYVMKKQNGKKAEEDGTYWRYDENTGEATEVKPEFCSMSRRPGIGKEWFEKFKSDVYPNDFVVLNGKKVRPPKYYDKLLEQDDSYALDDVKMDRVEKSFKWIEEQSEERLATREKVQLARLDRLVRPLE
ncbi:replication initiator protein [Microviridae sp.]|nr:replication initiator protein [Microviridae sp.]